MIRDLIRRMRELENRVDQAESKLEELNDEMKRHRTAGEDKRQGRRKLRVPVGRADGGEGTGA